MTARRLLKITLVALCLLGFLLPEADARTRRRRRQRVEAFFDRSRLSRVDNPLLRVEGQATIGCKTLNYTAIAITWDPSLRVPRAVAYELTATQVAMCDAPDAEKRKNYDFVPDLNVPRSPEKNDIELKRCGYSRGHMAPAMDMKWSKASMEECFYMTNICPQDMKLNNGAWQSLEQKIHYWAKRDGSLVIFTGPVFRTRQWLPPRREIGLPTDFYKIVYAPKQGRAIAFLYPNTPPKGSLESHTTDIDHIERLTSLRFLSILPKTIQKTLKKQSNLSHWDK